ncbi:MAG: four-carbon acid sugar kinase family protein [Desulfuromusa sp.]|nr:four-carbon acid sugar kinase family protein [Desulfuromusa sp.]
MTVATQALKIAVIADDLTGSADTGVQFCSVVGPVYLASLGDADFEMASEGFDSTGISINTNSRHVSRAEAAARVKMAVTGLRASGLKAEIIYKKIDSSLRGNIGAELDALLSETGSVACFVAPALPAQGRTTENDIHRLHGIPVAETEIAKDPLCPVSESRLSVYLQGQSEMKVGHVALATIESGRTFALEKVKRLRAEGCCHICFDAIDDRHLDGIAELGRIVSKELKILFCGSAGLAASLCRLLRPGSSPGDSEMSGGKERIRQNAAKWLMVCGSASDVSKRQVDRLVKNTGWEHRALGPDLLLADGSSRENSLRIKEYYGNLPAENGILSIDPKSEYPNVDPEELVKRFAAIGGKLAITTKPEILFLTGGDTAEAVLKKIGWSGIKLYREVLPGLVQGELCGGPLGGSIVVTKAGSFGEEDTLVKLVQQLS